MVYHIGFIMLYGDLEICERRLQIKFTIRIITLTATPIVEDAHLKGLDSLGLLIEII